MNLCRRTLLRVLGTLSGGTVVGSARGAKHDASVLDVDLRSIDAGDVRTVEWRGKPVFVRHRTPAEIRQARAVDLAQLREPESDEARTLRAPWLVVMAECTHGGCVPKPHVGKYGGWHCFCHGSVFDTSGRVREGPARMNLEVPPYRFIDAVTVQIGASDDTAH
jgi:ubiquinol-cytochrome c reductase iron-sulfur subunit